jgi:uncharacterized protein YecT (DUF1311 family)
MKHKKIIQSLTLLFLLISIQAYNTAAEKFNYTNYYYGIGVKKDYEKARKCLEQDPYSTAIPWLLLIYINGDGVKVDYNKALNIWQDSHLKDATMSYLYTIITNRMKHPNKKYKRLEFWDIAMTTIDINVAMGVQNALQKQKFDKKLHKIQQTMTIEQKKYFNNIEKYFNKILTNDASRAYTIYITGTIRAAMYQGTISYLRERHIKRIDDFLINKRYPRFSQDDFLQSDKELNIVYKDAQRIGKKRFEDEAKTEPKYIQYMADIKKYLKLSQRNWIKYRDNWVLLMNSLNNGSDKKSIAISIKTIITQSRTEELEIGIARFRD